MAVPTPSLSSIENMNEPPPLENLPFGTITKLTLDNFMMYDKLVMLPKPDINFIIGPKKSGKSAIFEAISLVFGKYSEKGQSFYNKLIRVGCDKAIVTAWIARESFITQKMSVILKKDCKPIYMWNETETLIDEYKEDIKRLYYIDSNNDCAFLSQEALDKFHRQSPQELLKSAVTMAKRDVIYEKRAIVSNLLPEKEDMDKKLKKSEEELKELEKRIEMHQNATKWSPSKKLHIVQLQRLEKKRKLLNIELSQSKIDTLRTKLTVKEDICTNLLEIFSSEDKKYKDLREEMREYNKQYLNLRKEKNRVECLSIKAQANLIQRNAKLKAVDIEKENKQIKERKEQVETLLKKVKLQIKDFEPELEKYHSIYENYTKKLNEITQNRLAEFEESPKNKEIRDQIEEDQKKKTETMDYLLRAWIEKMRKFDTEENKLVNELASLKLRSTGLSEYEKVVEKEKCIMGVEVEVEIKKKIAAIENEIMKIKTEKEKLFRTIADSEQYTTMIFWRFKEACDTVCEYKRMKKFIKDENEVKEEELLEEFDLTTLDEELMTEEERQIWNVVNEEFKSNGCPNDISELNALFSRTLEELGKNNRQTEVKQAIILLKELREKQVEHENLVNEYRQFDNRFETELSTFKEEITKFILGINYVLQELSSGLNYSVKVELAIPDNEYALEDYGIQLVVAEPPNPINQDLRNISSKPLKLKSILMYFLALQKFCSSPFRFIDGVTDCIDRKTMDQALTAFMNLWDTTKFEKTQIFITHTGPVKGINLRETSHLWLPLTRDTMSLCTKMKPYIHNIIESTPVIPEKILFEQRIGCWIEEQF